MTSKYHNHGCCCTVVTRLGIPASYGTFDNCCSSVCSQLPLLLPLLLHAAAPPPTTFLARHHPWSVTSRTRQPTLDRQHAAAPSKQMKKNQSIRLPDQ